VKTFQGSENTNLKYNSPGLHTPTSQDMMRTFLLKSSFLQKAAFLQMQLIFPIKIRLFCDFYHGEYSAYCNKFVKSKYGTFVLDWIPFLPQKVKAVL
jgi:hypothetical protein